MNKPMVFLRRIAHDARVFMPLLSTDPVEFYHRLAMSVANRREALQQAPDYETQSWEQAIDQLGTRLGVSAGDILSEAALTDIERAVRQAIAELPIDAPFALKQNADFTLARMHYLACRALKPQIVVETGVAYGVSSAFILKALAVNEKGTLHSVDLPPSIRDDAGQYIGYLIPAGLRARWHLHRGRSKQVLPRLLPQLGQIDLFVHDSLHAFKNMLWEFRVVGPYMSPRAMLIADDIDGNQAFSDWVAEANPAFWGAIRQVDKQSIFGIGLLVRDGDPANG